MPEEFDGIKAKLALDHAGFDSGLNASKEAANAFKRTILEVGAALGIAFSIDRVVQFGKSIVQASADGQEALQNLSAALGRAGIQQPHAAAEAMDKFARSVEAYSTQSHTTIDNVMAMGLSMGLTTEQTKIATKAAVDFAAQTHQSVEGAMMKMIGAMETGRLRIGRVSLELDKGKMSADNFGTVIAKVNENFGGSAAAMAGTYNGRIEQLSNAWTDLKEAIGDAVTSNKTINAVLVVTKEHLISAVHWIGEHKKTLLDWVKTGWDASIRAVEIFLHIAAPLAQVMLLFAKAGTLASYSVMEGLRAVAYAGEVVEGTVRYITMGFTDFGRIATQAILTVLDAARPLIALKVKLHLTDQSELDALDAARAKVDSVNEALNQSGQQQKEEIAARKVEYDKIFEEFDGYEEKIFKMVQAEIDAGDMVGPVREAALAKLKELRAEVDRMATSLRVVADVGTKNGIEGPKYKGNEEEEKKKRLAALAELKKEIEAVNAAAKQLGDTYGAAMGQFVAGSISAKEAAKKMALESLRAAKDYFIKTVELQQAAAIQAQAIAIQQGQTQIGVDAATGAAGAASATAVIPIVGPALAIGAAAAMFAFIEAYSTKFASGSAGKGAGTGDVIPAMVDPKEVIIPAPGRYVSPDIRDAALARVGGGQGGTVHNHYWSFMIPPSTAEFRRILRDRFIPELNAAGALR